MGINIVKYGNTTVMDITDTTATASDVASGKYFYGKDGVKTLGTASGGSGLVYESGTYTPTADSSRPTISFTGTHTLPPCYISIYDCTTSSVPASNSVVAMTYIDSYRMFNSGYSYSSSAQRYGTIQYIYKGSSSSSLNTGTVHFTYNSDTSLPSNGGTSYAQYWATKSDFKPYSNSTSRYFRKNRTYKWFAVWK